MADAIQMFNACATLSSKSPQATTDAANIASQYALDGRRGIPSDVALRGAKSATERQSVSDTLGCYSNALTNTQSTEGAIGGFAVGQGNLDYARAVKQIYDAIRQ